MTYDSDNLFSGIRLVSQEELRDSQQDPDIDTNTNQGEEDESQDALDTSTQVEDTFSEEINESAFSIVKPTREASTDTSENNSDTDLGDDPDIQAQANNIEEEQDVDIKAKKYLAFAKELVERGVISEINEEEFDPSAEGLTKLFSEEASKNVQKEISKFKSSFSGAKKTFLEIEDAFDSEVEAIQVAKKLDFFNNLNPDTLEGNDQLAKEIYSESLRLAGFSPEEVSEYIEEASDLGKLQDKASKSIKGIKSHYEKVVEKGRESQEAKVKAFQKQQEDNFNSLMNAVETKESIIDGLPYTKIHKDKLKDNLTKVAYTDENGRVYNEVGYKQMKNPKEFEILVNYLDTLGVFNMDKSGNFKPDLSKLKKIAKSKASNELDKIISQEEAKGKSKQAFKKSNNPSRVTDDIIAKLDRAKGRK